MSSLFFGGLFWGILISLIGLSIVLRYAFNIHIPIIRIFFGVVIILIGLRLIIGHTTKSKVDRSYTFSENVNKKDYDIVFSSATIDLTKLEDYSKLPKEISVVFGNETVIIPDSINLEVTSTTVFGSTILPDRSYSGFSEDRFLIKKNNDGDFYKILTTTIFGKLIFEEVRISKKPDGEDLRAIDSQNESF